MSSLVDREWQRLMPSAHDRAMHLDFETRSVIDLKKHGVHVYAMHPSTDVQCACFRYEDGPVQSWLPGEPCPDLIHEHVARGGRIWAHNVMFERLIWRYVMTPKHGWPEPRHGIWGCTMARAYALALPGSLDHAAHAVGLTNTKDSDGHRTMIALSKPRRYLADGTPVWWDDEVRSGKLLAYCRQDVEVEYELHTRIPHLNDTEKKVWELDQRINDRGIRIDVELCRIAKDMIETAMLQLNDDMRAVSNGQIQTVSSVAQIIHFCAQRGVRATDKAGKQQDIKSIRADQLDRMLARPLPPDVRRVLEIRREASKVSVKKIQALLTDCGQGDRVRGLLAYHAATTGRWAGRRFQPQNIRRPELKDQDFLIKLVRGRRMEAIDLLGGPISVISDIIRGMIISSRGRHLFAADFSNIEGRALAWLANEEWKLKAFRDFDNGKGPDIYVLAYSRAFHVPIDDVTDEMRQIGKVMELALGFGGGARAFQAMAVNYGVEVSDERAEELKLAWRKAHPKVTAFWQLIERCAVRALIEGKTVECGEMIKMSTPIPRLQFSPIGDFLRMRLPSGRYLSYPYAEMRPVLNMPGRDVLTYKTAINAYNKWRLADDESPTGGWGRISAWFGILVENAVQAIARDIMAEAMLRVEEDGFPVVLTVHDEIVSESKSDRTEEEFKRLVEISPSWAVGFPIAAKAWKGDRYKKG